MLTWLKTLSTQRRFWLFMAFSAFVLEMTALYFQYGMNLAPCVMCVYERAALFAILGVGLFGTLAPNFILTRIITILLGMISAVKGLSIAIKHTDYQLHPGPWNQCSAFADFPKSLPLDKWIPALFQPYGECSDVVWSFLGLSMAQWIAVMFAGYLIIFFMLFFSQFVRTRRRNRMLFTK